MADFLFKLGVTVLRPPVLSWFKFDVRGLDWVPTDGPVIIASNHISHMDPFALARTGLLLHPTRRYRFLAKAELFEKQPLAWAMRRLGQIPVDRGTAAASDSLRSAREALERGEAVVIFPEGTVSVTFVPMRPHTGVGRLALDSGAPVVPAGVWGTHRSMTKYRERDLSWRRPVTIDYGPPRVYTSDDGDAHAVTEAIFKRVIAEVVSARARYPEAPGPDDWWGPPAWPIERAGRWRPKLDKSMTPADALAEAHAAMAGGRD
ncbi:MAG: 1-acyl-sn-glycerol-3-phosphate acyltransferase [Acidimicrobiia bacterium]|nr:1-acyl-sn-glycerol-3-phosphate acyltransferase [Acidimicrobiia bacterium]